ncbi:Radical SAM domain protein [Desulfatibacillum aliphaticivorans]|uniref:Radical SAM domain protein n=1 Tax=Desulfatibacillum aliphaticivorans TaxID=218208 RepID=B8FAP5_DESAL|nr:radical SAM protein [Desulfatibacillum aliphaticivorans]ACL03341.1 Radical SAM domain protein [Desulfatibacillum aliphaticivorans]
MSAFEPAYIKTKAQGLLEQKIAQAREIMKECTLCPRECKVNRLDHQTGVCKTGPNAVVSSFGPHFGEEKPLVGKGGSGTIFFANCNLLCLFCQNYGISHLGEGEEVGPDSIAQVMIQLQDAGCPNINFVTPSHVIPQILQAVDMAADKGLHIPLVYNSGGYDSVESLKLLDGVVDIYMPDFKFWHPEIAENTCKARDYRQIACAALREMHRQVGDLQINEQGLAERGLLVRHLVLPGKSAGTKQIMEFIAQHISPNTYVNIMPQYRPVGRAKEVPGLESALPYREYEQAVAEALKAGISRLDERRRVFRVEYTH